MTTKALATGTRVGEFSIEKLLGRGGQSLVYLARDKQGKAKVLKELAPMKMCQRDAQLNLQWQQNKVALVAEWQQQFKLSQSSSHPALYRFEQWLESNNTIYLVGPYWPGQSLFQHLNQICFEGQMPQSRLLRLLLPVIQGINSLHKQGLFHGDIKPANIYLALDDKVMLLDGVTDGTGRLDQSQGYTAPEVSAHQTIEKQSDYFSLAQLMSTLMTGEVAPVNGKLSNVERYDYELVDFVESCLQSNWQHRPASLLPLVNILNGINSGQQSLSTTHDVPTVKVEQNRYWFSGFWRKTSFHKPMLWSLFGAAIGVASYSLLPSKKADSANLPLDFTNPAPIEVAVHETEIDSDSTISPLPSAVIPETRDKLRDLKPIRKPNKENIAELPAEPPAIVTNILAEMVALPAGSFWLGSSNGDRAELPVTKTEVSAFRLLSHEVTYSLYSQCVKQKQCRQPVILGDASLPVTGISYQDIQLQFLPWLNSMSEHKFRLPTEAEWEYAAKFEIGEGYAWGDEVGQNLANCRGCGGPLAGRKAGPVKSFAASPAGLFDMNGNVEEWVESCWKANHDEATPDTCNTFTVKGGSWDSRIHAIRNSARRAEIGSRRSSVLGFRLALSN